MNNDWMPRIAFVICLVGLGWLGYEVSSQQKDFQACRAEQTERCLLDTKNYQICAEFGNRYCR